MRVLVAAIAISLSHPAMAEFCGPGLLSVDNRSIVIERVIQKLSTVVDRVEGVPSEEFEYIERETTAALMHDSRARFGLVLQRPYYHAYMVRKQHKIVAAQLVGAKGARTVVSQALYLAEALSAYGDFQEALKVYFDFDHTRPNRVIPSSVVGDMSFNVAAVRFQILRDLRCAIQQLREPG